MILASEALATVLSNTRDYGTVIVPIEKATGRTLARDVTADRDFPPFDRVMMDGIAINSSAFSSGLRSFIVEGTQFAGSPRLQLSSGEHCLEVMTGAMLPLHADCVVRYEDITIENWRATINLDTVAPFQHVHRQGSDRKSGEVLLREGTAIRPPEIAVLSTVGMEKIEVKKLPKVAIIYTGDELVGIHETPQPHQIRASNNYAIRAGLFSRGIKSDWFHLHDEKEVIRESVGAILESHDVIILSGAVSKGKKDFVPEVLEELGIEKLFHRVSQRPGKPFWFGKNDDTVVFALPGNPVSVYMCFCYYVIAWMDKTLGQSARHEVARLKQDFSFEPDLTYFLQVKLEVDEEAVLWASPIPGQGSGDFANLMDTEAFLILPREKTHFRKGEVYPLLRYV